MIINWILSAQQAMKKCSEIVPTTAGWMQQARKVASKKASAVCEMKSTINLTAM